VPSVDWHWHQRRGTHRSNGIADNSKVHLEKSFDILKNIRSIDIAIFQTNQ